MGAAHRQIAPPERHDQLRARALQDLEGTYEVLAEPVVVARSAEDEALNIGRLVGTLLVREPPKRRMAKVARVAYYASLTFAGIPGG